MSSFLTGFFGELGNQFKGHQDEQRVNNMVEKQDKIAKLKETRDRAYKVTVRDEQREYNKGEAAKKRTQEQEDLTATQTYDEGVTKQKQTYESGESKKDRASREKIAGMEPDKASKMSAADSRYITATLGEINKLFKQGSDSEAESLLSTFNDFYVGKGKSPLTVSEVKSPGFWETVGSKIGFDVDFNTKKSVSPGGIMNPEEKTGGVPKKTDQAPPGGFTAASIMGRVNATEPKQEGTEPEMAVSHEPTLPTNEVVPQSDKGLMQGPVDEPQQDSTGILSKATGLESTDEFGDGLQDVAQAAPGIAKTAMESIMSVFKSSASGAQKFVDEDVLGFLKTITDPQEFADKFNEAFPKQDLKMTKEQAIEMIKAVTPSEWFHGWASRTGAEEKALKHAQGSEELNNLTLPSFG